MSEILLYSGISLVVISVVAGIVAGTILHFKRKMLEIKLDEEYGKKMK